MSDRRPVCDLHLVVEVVHRAGLVCELVQRQNAHPLIRARPRESSSTAWTVNAGLCSADPRHPAGAFVGPADSAWPLRAVHLVTPVRPGPDVEIGDR